VRNGSVALHDLVDRPVIGLDSRDPVGTSLSQACRQAGVGFQQAVVTVQTYHAALSMAHHGLGVALVDACTARSADSSKVDVLALEPHIPVPVRALRFAGKPDSVAVRGITRCMREAIEQAV
jgi:DNA-binding transcriptional LysR family regulator